MLEYFQMSLPIILTAFTAYCLYQIQRDHRRTTLATALRTELGLTRHAVYCFFEALEKQGTGQAILEELKDSNFFYSVTRIYNANLDDISLLGRDLSINLALIYSILDRFQQTPKKLLFKKYENGFSQAEVFFDGIHRHLPIFAPDLFYYSLPWWRRIGLDRKEAHKIVKRKSDFFVYGKVEAIPRAIEKYESTKKQSEKSK